MSSEGTPDIPSIIKDRKIEEVLHFTTHLGFVGCLSTGLVLPRNRLKEDSTLKYIMHLNSSYRSEENEFFDKSQNWIDYVNLNISEINSRFFRISERWHQSSDVLWLILSFDPALLNDAGVYFVTTNNIYELAHRTSGTAGLQALFEQRVQRRPGWVAMRDSRDPRLPTCEQAEVLYPAGLPMSYLRRVYVRDGPDADWVYSALQNASRTDVAIVTDKTKFLGMPN